MDQPEASQPVSLCAIKPTCHLSMSSAARAGPVAAVAGPLPRVPTGPGGRCASLPGVLELSEEANESTPGGFSWDTGVTPYNIVGMAARAKPSGDTLRRHTKAEGGSLCWGTGWGGQYFDVLLFSCLWDMEGKTVA